MNPTQTPPPYTPPSTPPPPPERNSFQGLQNQDGNLVWLTGERVKRAISLAMVFRPPNQ